MRILLTGAKGQVGQCFKDRLPEDWELIASDSKTLNITDAGNVLNMVKTFEPDVVINAAAYTNVDKAEAQQALAFAVNADGTRNLARAAQAVGARFIHISTDYVFDGNQGQPIDEDCAPNPINVYGQSKLAGEILALNAHIDTVVVRTSWVYSEYGHNFVKSMLKRGREHDEVAVAADQTGCPTYAGDLAQVLIDIAANPAFPRGIYHYSGQQSMSWYEFARRIFQTAAQTDGHFAQVKVKAISGEEVATVARRAPFTVLNTQRLREQLSPSRSETPLQEVIQRLLA